MSKYNTDVIERFEKECSCCKELKSIDNFSKNITNKDGYAYWCRDCHNEANKSWRSKNMEKVRELRKIDYLKQFSKKVARDKLYRAIKNGKVKKSPCVVCGDKNSEAHHHFGYYYPLEVIWLCKIHHGRHHSYLKSLIDKSILEERERIVKYRDKNRKPCGQCCRETVIDDILQILEESK